MVIVSALILITGFLSSTSAYAATITQGEFAVALAAELGLGKGLTPEKAVKALKRVGIVPSKGWRLKEEVTCEFVAEIQELTVLAAQRGLIRYDPEQIPTMLASLCEGLGVCAPPTIVVYPAVPVSPPPITAELKGETCPSPWK